MGIQQKITYTIVDDMDGTVIESDDKPDPIELVYGGTGYRLYLSEANAKKLDTYLAKIIKDAETYEPGRSAGASTNKSAAQKAVEASGDTFQSVKSWAVDQNLKGANGNPITERAPRISPEAWAAYAKAHDIEVT